MSTELSEQELAVCERLCNSAKMVGIQGQSMQSALKLVIADDRQLRTELADLRKRHGDNLKFIDTLVSEKAVAWKRIKELEDDLAYFKTVVSERNAEMMKDGLERQLDGDLIDILREQVIKLKANLATVTAENESLRKGAPLGPIIGAETIVEQELELKKLRKQVQHSLANNLCPDHRDKQQGKPCLACEIEKIESKNESLRERLDLINGGT